MPIQGTLPAESNRLAWAAASLCGAPNEKEISEKVFPSVFLRRAIFPVELSAFLFYV